MTSADQPRRIYPGDKVLGEEYERFKQGVFGGKSPERITGETLRRIPGAVSRLVGEAAQPYIGPAREFWSGLTGETPSSARGDVRAGKVPGASAGSAGADADAAATPNDTPPKDRDTDRPLYTNLGDKGEVLSTIVNKGASPAGSVSAETMEGLRAGQWQPTPRIASFVDSQGEPVSREDLLGRFQTQAALDQVYGSDQEIAERQDPRVRELENLNAQAQLSEAREIAAAGGEHAYRTSQALKNVQMLSDMIDRSIQGRVEALTKAGADPQIVQQLLAEGEAAKARIISGVLGMK